ncbi:MAG: hypothetical protein WC878_01000 [Candidatus Paceibacterota bacterium]|jgi:hypothetical protein
MQENIQIKSISLYDFEQKMFWLFATLIFCTLVFYMYVISSTILNIVARETAERDVKSANSVISVLESEYIALGRNLDLNNAKDLGYREVAEVDYVSRTPVLTMRDHGR